MGYWNNKLRREAGDEGYRRAATQGTLGSPDPTPTPPPPAPEPETTEE